MANKSKIISLNEGFARELHLTELEHRIELSPIGILDLLVSSPDFGDAEAADCKNRGSCSDYNNCNVDDCSPHCGMKNCNAQPACPGDACERFDDCSTYG